MTNFSVLNNLMMKKKHLLDAIETRSHAGIKPDMPLEAYVRLAEFHANEHNTYELLLVLMHMYHGSGFRSQVFELAVQLLDCSPNHLTGNFEREGLERNLFRSAHKGTFAVTRQVAIQLCIRFLRVDTLSHVAVVAALHEEVPELAFLSRIKEIFLPTHEFEGRDIVFALTSMPGSVRKSEQYYEDIVTMLITKMSTLPDAEQWLLATWAYFLYLGNEVVTTTVLQFLNLSDDELSSAYERFLQHDQWPWIMKRDIVAFYYWHHNKIEGQMKTQAIQLPETISNLPSPLLALVPTILYAQQRSSIEVVSQLLTAVVKDEACVDVVSLLEEVSGDLKVSDEYKKLRPENRADWLKNKETVTHFKAQRFKCYPQTLTNIRQIYALRPFNSGYVTAAIQADSAVKGNEFRKMYEYSIARITSPHTLGVILMNTILTCGNERAFKVLVGRMEQLNHYNHLQHAAEKVIEITKGKLSVHMRSQIVKIIKRYEAAKPAKQPKKWMVDFWKQDENQGVDAELFTTDEAADISNYKMASAMFELKKYSDLIQYAQARSTPAPILELALRAALAIKDVKKILSLYQRLAKLDVSIAVSYNSQLIPFLLIINRNKKEKVTKGLASNIWQVAVYLENPVNRTAKNLTV